MKNQYNSEGKQDGYWEYYYYSNGQLYSKGNYKNDMYDGYWEGYYDNGEISFKGHYVNDNRDGIWEYYYSNGELYKKEYFI